MSDRRAWAAGVRRIHEEADGVMTLQVIQSADMPELIAHVMLGDPVAARLGNLVSQTLHGIAKAPRKKPMLCGSCPRRLQGGKFSLVFAIPYVGDPRDALSLAICQHCGNDYNAIVGAAGRALRRIWPDSRFVDIHPAEGHA